MNVIEMFRSFQFETFFSERSALRVRIIEISDVIFELFENALSQQNTGRVSVDLKSVTAVRKRNFRSLRRLNFEHFWCEIAVSSDDRSVKIFF